MVTTTKRFTAQDLWQMPNNEFLELWRGEIVELSPSGLKSSAIAVNFIHAVKGFVKAHNLGVVSASGTAVSSSFQVEIPWLRLTSRS